MTETESRADRKRPALQPFVTALLALLVCVSLALNWRNRELAQQQTQQLEALTSSFDAVLAEVSRIRIEQSATGKGPRALLEKLRTYAPLAVDSRTTEPDFQNAKRELVAIMRAFEATGQDAWKPLQDRLAELDPKQQFDEAKWLLEASLRVDEEATKQLLKDILLGLRMPNPRLRWWAADLLIQRDKPLAASLLRRVLLTESSRGVNPDRIGHYPGMAIPDQAAYAQTGFHNFVQKYLRSDDPKTEDTLLMLLGRVEHDAVTIQECIKALGERKCDRAVEPIQKLYRDPPLQQQNPLFLIICVRAVFDIQQCEAKQWLEQVLGNAPTQEVADVAADLLKNCQ